MPGAVQSIVDAVQTRVGVDATPSEVLAALNERHKTMCVRAEIFTPDIALAVTVVDQADYDLPGNVAAVMAVSVDGVPWQDASRRQVAGLNSGGCWSLWAPTGVGVFSVVRDQDGSRVRLFPAPDEAGLAIVARVVERPGDLALTDAPLVDEEYYRALREGTTATFLAEDAEQIPVADRYEARFDAACQEQRVQVLKARRSTGAAQIGLRGVTR